MCAEAPQQKKGDKNDLITERKQPALRSEISGTALH
jgi:hypothetical protein